MQQFATESGPQKGFAWYQNVIACHDYDFRPHLVDWSAPCVYPRGTIIFQQGSRADRLYYIDNGLVKLTVSECNGRQIIVGLRRNNWILAASAVILQARYLATATTLTQCILRSTQGGLFREKLRNDMEISIEINRMLSREIQNDFARLATLGCMDARERLRTFLCEIIESLPEQQMPQGIEIPLKNYEISEITGVTPEHVCRILRQMESDGLIRRTGRRLTISNPVQFLYGSSTCS